MDEESRGKETNVEIKVLKYSPNMFNIQIDSTTSKNDKLKNKTKRKVGQNRHSEKLFSCDLCDFIGKDQEKIDVHKNTNHGTLLSMKGILHAGTLFICQKCGFENTRKAQMVIHIKAKHAEGMQYECSDCDYKSPRRPHITRHMRRRHGNCPLKIPKRRKKADENWRKGTNLEGFANDDKDAYDILANDDDTDISAKEKKGNFKYDENIKEIGIETIVNKNENIEVLIGKKDKGSEDFEDISNVKKVEIIKDIEKMESRNINFLTEQGHTESNDLGNFRDIRNIKKVENIKAIEKNQNNEDTYTTFGALNELMEMFDTKTPKIQSLELTVDEIEESSSLNSNEGPHKQDKKHDMKRISSDDWEFQDKYLQTPIELESDHTESYYISELTKELQSDEVNFLYESSKDKLSTKVSDKNPNQDGGMFQLKDPLEVGNDTANKVKVKVEVKLEAEFEVKVESEDQAKTEKQEEMNTKYGEFREDQDEENDDSYYTELAMQEGLEIDIETDTSTVKNKDIKTLKNANQTLELNKAEKSNSCIDGNTNWALLDKKIESLIMKNGNKWECKVCGKVAQRENMKYHAEKHIEGVYYKCPVCEKVFNTRSSVRSHKYEAHGGRKYSCDQCDFTSNRPRRIRIHKQFTHEEIDKKVKGPKVPNATKFPEVPKNPKIPNDSKYKCKDCSFSSKSINAVREHDLIIHQGITPECLKCGVKFRRKGYLKNHMMIVHGGTKFACGECDFKTVWKDQVRVHKKRFHAKNVMKIGENKYIFTCEHCELQFKKKNYLAHHMIQEHNAPCLVCEICASQFTEKKSLQKHKSSKHTEKSPILPVITCENCEYKTSSISSMGYHVKSTHKGKKYPCHPCMKSFQSQANLDKHMAFKHDPTRPANFKRKKILVKKQCDLCNYQVLKLSGLRNHQLKKHSPMSVSSQPGKDGFVDSDFTKPCFV